MSVTRDTRTLVLIRDDYSCVRCNRPVMGGDYSLHHRRPRGMGGSKRADTDLAGNLITLCGSGTTGCHGWVESHRSEASGWGYIVPQNAVPASIPVRYGDQWAQITDSGRLATVATGDRRCVDCSRQLIHGTPPGVSLCQPCLDVERAERLADLPKPRNAPAPLSDACLDFAASVERMRKEGA